MKFRTQLYLFLFALTFVTALIGLGTVYWHAERVLFDELRSKVLTLAATAAQAINGDLLVQIRNKNDVHSAQFNTLTKEMRSFIRVNQRDDIVVKDMYTVHPDSSSPSHLVVGVDASEDPVDFAAPGEPYPESHAIGIYQHLKDIWAPHQLVKDRWGIFLPGYAPIYDKEGVYVATLGVNLSASYITQKLHHLQLLFFTILFMTLIIGFVAAALLARTMSVSIETINEVVGCIGHGDLKQRIQIHGNNEFSHLAAAINDMAQGLEEREKLKLNFARYISKDIMEQILSADVMPSLQGERCKITVLFSDLREFTHLAEKYPPEEVVLILNEYLEQMIHIIFRNNGTLDKFLGDGIMVEFGAPLEDAEQENHAVEAALQMHHALEKLNIKWDKEGRPKLEMGIGIHTGQAIVGNIGSEKRMEFTAIGDTVNVASRLEQMSKQLKVNILISETTMCSLDETYNMVRLGEVLLHGRESPIEVFSIVAKAEHR